MSNRSENKNSKLLNFILKNHPKIFIVEAISLLAVVLLTQHRLEFYLHHFYFLAWIIIFPLYYQRQYQETQKDENGIYFYQIIATTLLLLDAILLYSIPIYVDVLWLNCFNFCIFGFSLIQLIKWESPKKFLGVIFFLGAFIFAFLTIRNITSPFLNKRKIPLMQQAAEEWMKYKNDIIINDHVVERLEFYMDDFTLYVAFRNHNGEEKKLNINRLKDSSPISKLKAGMALTKSFYFVRIVFYNEGGYIYYDLGEYEEDTKYRTISSTEYYCIKNLYPLGCEDEKNQLGKRNNSYINGTAKEWLQQKEIGDCLFYFERYTYWYNERKKVKKYEDE